MQEKVAALLKDPEKRVAFYRRLLSKRSIATPRDPIIELLKIDPRFFKFYGDIVALDREAGLIPNEVAVWDELTAHEKGVAGGSNASEAVRLVNDVEALRPLAAGDPEMENRVADLADQARRAARLVNVGGRPVREGGRVDAGAGGRGAQAARAAGRRHQHHRQQGAGRSGQAAARAAAPGAPDPHRRRHRQEEEARDRDREPAPGPLPGRPVRDAAARGVDGRRRGILAVRR